MKEKKEEYNPKIDEVAIFDKSLFEERDERKYKKRMRKRLNIREMDCVEFIERGYYA